MATICTEDGKIKLQKCHLVMSIYETYAVFQEENPELKIGLCKFAELRHKNVFIRLQTQ